MHCPDCGQQQISDEIRFCSRCGFPLSAVSQVVANRGALPVSPDALGKRSWLTRKKGIFIGVVWMLFFILLVAGMLDELKAPGEIVSAAAIFGIFSGVVMILASAFFLKHENREYHDAYRDQHRQHRQHGPVRYEIDGARPASTLPPQQSIPVQNYAQAPRNRWDTNDLVQPSVTENTTRLLNNEQFNSE
jgi:hypothetical protein